MKYTKLAAPVAAMTIAAATVLGGATAAQAKARPDALTADGTTFKVRPQMIGYTGDGTGFVGRLPRTTKGKIIWASWTSSEARGRGAVWLKDCSPSCAEGKWIRYRGKVTLSKPRKGHFTRLAVKVPGMPADVRYLRDSGSFYAWTPSY